MGRACSVRIAGSAARGRADPPDRTLAHPRASGIRAGSGSTLAGSSLMMKRPVIFKRTRRGRKADADLAASAPARRARGRGIRAIPPGTALAYSEAGAGHRVHAGRCAPHGDAGPSKGNHDRLSRLGGAAVVALACAARPPASAQTWPTQQPVRIVVPFSAGSATDLLARTLADKLAERWKPTSSSRTGPACPAPPPSPRARRTATR